ncbi:hypothetical protein MMC16_005573 [Acarospora aff. strigata]|nr:hypothetical protein [Acarospora aff. strigata]
MSASNIVHTSSSHLSLANSASSGTSFAAKARAAELNAARARRETRELEENEVPVSAPVSLGAFTKFTKPRNRGKGWKPFNLNEDQDNGRAEGQEDADDSGSSSDYEVRGRLQTEDVSRGKGILRDIGNLKNPHPLRQQLATEEISTTNQARGVSPEVPHTDDTGGEFDVDEWDPNLPSASLTNRESPLQTPQPPHQEFSTGGASIAEHKLELKSESHVQRTEVPIETENRYSRLASPLAIDKNITSLGLSQAVAQHRMPTVEEIESRTITAKNILPPVQEAKLALLGVRNLAADTNLPPGQEAKLASLGVLPPFVRDPNKPPVPTLWPRAEASFPYSNNDNGVRMPALQMLDAYQFDANTSRQHYGPMNFDFRFPAQPQLPHYSQHHTMNPYEQQGYFNLNQQTQMMPYAQETPNYQAVHGMAPTANFEGSNMQQAPYMEAPMTNKRDMLLKSLHDVVESSRARESTRTVLYDPVTQGEPSQNRIVEVEQTPRPANTDHGVLQDSEPLPGWKTRPVNIHDELTPVMTNAELSVLSKQPRSDVSPSNASTGVNPRASFPAASTSHARSRLSMIQDAEEWWNADHRGAGELRVYLNQVAEDDKIRKQIQANERPAQTAQQQTGNSTDNWPDTSTTTTTTPNPNPAASDTANRLLIDVLANFHGYLSGPPEAQRGQFGSFGPVPEWCIDKGVGGSTSFFGEDWGAPPPRVGRDPRYRPLLHEPRFTLYEELERRGGVEGIYGRRYR